MIILRKEKKIPLCISLLSKLLVKYCHSASLPSGFWWGLANEPSSGNLRGYEGMRERRHLFPAPSLPHSRNVFLWYPQLLVGGLPCCDNQKGMLLIMHRCPPAPDHSHNPPTPRKKLFNKLSAISWRMTSISCQDSFLLGNKAEKERRVIDYGWNKIFFLLISWSRTHDKILFFNSFENFHIKNVN